MPYPIEPRQFSRKAAARPLQAARALRLVCRSAPSSELPGWRPQPLIWAHKDSPFFEWGDEAGELLWTFPIYSLDGILIDWCAWRREQPCRWWLKTGASIVSSPWLIERAVHWAQPVHFVSTPEQWIVDPRNRAVILQPALFDFAYELQRYPITASEDFEAWLRAQASRQLMSRITIGRPHAGDPAVAGRGRPPEKKEGERQ